MELHEQQKELDQVKWNKSVNLGIDACGTFDYCRCCEKHMDNPCARALFKMNGVDVESREVVERVEQLPVETVDKPLVETVEKPLVETKPVAKKTTAKKTTTKKTTAKKTTTKSTSKKSTTKKSTATKKTSTKKSTK